MGYDVHITRANLWSENEGCEISVEEWHALIDSDPELRLAGYNGPHFMIWSGHPDDTEAWLDWVEGNITTKNPDEPLLTKMLEIAARLNAKVQGDEGEVYTRSGLAIEADEKGLLASGHGISFALSVLALALLPSLVMLDSWVRPGQVPNTPVPMAWALVMGFLMAVGGISWLAATVFAVLSFLSQEPRKRLAWLALLTNIVTLAALLTLR